MARHAQTQSFRHNRLENVALPYITNMSVTDVRPHYIAGSHDILTSVDGTASHRPGTLVGDPVTNTPFAAGDIKRYFAWNKSTSEAFLFASVVNGFTSEVWKIQYSVDADWVLLYSSAIAPGEPFDYVVSHGFVYFANGTYSLKYDGTTVTNWGIVGPTVAPTAVSAGSGSVPAFIGHQYCYAYGVSTTGYLSDISPLSAVFSTPLQQVTVSGDGCIDTQCDEVHVFRTEDGGANLYELSNSPIANSSPWSLVDNDTDDDLDFESPAPLRYVNAPAPPMLHPTLFAGRIWGYKGDKLFRSTLEENNTSVPEDCFNISPSTTEAYRFGRDINGLAVAGNFLLVYCNHGIFKIGGDSLSTFYRSTLSKNLGLHNRQNLADFQGDVVWLDSSNTIRVTDGETVGKPDLSQPIRPDIRNIAHASAQVIVHDDGLHSWIMLMDGANGIVYVFDVDTKQWMPPWNWSGITCMYSNPIYSNGIFLQIARSGRLLQVVEASTYPGDVIPTVQNPSGDDVVFPSAEQRISLTPINTDAPTGINEINYVAVERRSDSPDGVEILVDEDPADGDYASIFHNEEDPDQRIPGTHLVEKWYWNRMETSPGQRVSVKITWPAVYGTLDDPFKVHTIDIVHTPTK